ncbi:MAG: hypothetical protein NXH86_04065 [Flavobacteriaceae bacterium]|nr:hypothetical protein [Flavobacteriaceae bacterium]
MAGETFLKGKVKIISIWDGSAYRPVACDTTNSLETALSDGASIVTKCDPDNVVTSPGAFSYSLSGEGVQIDTTSSGAETTKASHDWLLTKQQAKTLVTWKRATGLTDTVAYYGTGYITNLSDVGDAGEDNPNATYSFEITGTGAIATIDPEAET